MADFLSEFWSWFIIVLTVLGLAGCVMLLWAQTDKKSEPGQKPETMGHVWDEDLYELNNPLPYWWLLLFYGSIVFAVVYLVLYPGLGSFAGALGWTQVGKYEAEQAAAERAYGAIFDRYLSEDLTAVAADPEALEIGKRLFANYCSQCHGSDAGGARGYPNLRDQDWLYGGTPEAIKKSIVAGRTGIMPAWGGENGVLTDKQIFDVSEYVRTLSGHDADDMVTSRGKTIYAENCAVCHEAEGRGSYLFGAPNLTDDIWLYGGSQKRIIESVELGRMGQMPANQEFLGKAKIHLLAAYVHSLSRIE